MIQIITFIGVLLLVVTSQCCGQVVINEVANIAVPSSSCRNVAYIELFNSGSSAVAIGSRSLYCSGSYEFIIPDGTTILPNQFLLFCTGTCVVESNLGAFIDFDDEAGLYDTVLIPREGFSANITYSRRRDGTFTFTYPTPNAMNPFIVPIPVAVPVKVPVPIMVPLPPIPVPVKVPLAVPVPVLLPLPISVPVRPITIPLPLAIPIPIPINVPQPLPVLSPIHQVPFPVTAPVPVPTPTKVFPPIPVPIKVPTPIQIPIVSTRAPTKSQTGSPIIIPEEDDDCGLFGLNFFCPSRGECGFWRRVFNIGDCE